MNKYAAIGLIREAVKGRCIVVVTGIPVGTSAALDEFAALLRNASEVTRITRANGAQSVRFEGGGRIEVRTQPPDVRGTAADVIYLDTGIASEISYDEIRSHLLPALARSEHGEIIRA